MVELQISMIPNTIMGPIVASEASTRIFNKLDNPDETFIKTQIPVEVSNVTIQKLALLLVYKTTYLYAS